MPREVSGLQAARWPIPARVGAAGVAFGRVAELSCTPRYLLPHPLLLGPLGVDELGGLTDGEDAEFVGFGPRQSSSRPGVAGVAFGVGGAHAELVAAGVIDPVLARE